MQGTEREKMQKTGEVTVQLGRTMEQILNFVYGGTPTGMVLTTGKREDAWFCECIPDTVRLHLFRMELIHTNMHGQLTRIEQRCPRTGDVLVFEQTKQGEIFCTWTIEDITNASQRMMDTLILLEHIPADVPVVTERKKWIADKRAFQRQVTDPMKEDGAFAMFGAALLIGDTEQTRMQSALSHPMNDTVAIWEPPFPHAADLYDNSAGDDG